MGLVIEACKMADGDGQISEKKDEYVAVEMCENGNEVNCNGRFDDFGRFVQNLEEMPAESELFKKLEKFRCPSAVILTICEGDVEDVSREDVYDCMKLLSVDFSNIRAIVRSAPKSRRFNVDFTDITWKKHVISTINKQYSEKYKVHAVIQDVINVTVMGLPVHIEDADVLEFLNIFGDFNSNLDEVIHRFDKRGSHIGERVYTAKSITIDIPSFWWLYGHQINIRYPRQPQTCRTCGKRGHRAFECPDNEKRTTTVLVEGDDVSGVSTYAGKVSNNDHGSGRGTRPYRKPTLRRQWKDGGYRPNGLRPQYLGNNEKHHPGSATLGDYVTKATAKQNLEVLKKKSGQGKLRKVEVISAAKANALQENEKLIRGVDEKLEHVQRIVAITDLVMMMIKWWRWKFIKRWQMLKC